MSEMTEEDACDKLAKIILKNGLNETQIAYVIQLFHHHIEQEETAAMTVALIKQELKII